VDFNRAFRLSSLLLAAIALAGLVLAHTVPLWLSLPIAVIFTVTLRQEWMGKRTLLPETDRAPLGGLWNVLVVAAFGLFLVDLAAISRDLLSAGIRFLVMLLGVKLCTLRQARDYRHLHALSLMAILASAALTTEVWYLWIFLLYLLGAVWTLLLHHLTSQAAAAAGGSGSSVPAPFPSRINHRFFWLTNVMALVTFVLTLAIFFVLPRIGVGMLQKSRGEGLKTTGFSERVDLGTIGSIKQDPQIVMRVELPDQTSSKRDRLYLRGLAYDRYDGRAWNTSTFSRRTLAPIGDNTFAVPPGGRSRSVRLTDPLQQDILLEALDTTVLFAAPFAESISGDLGTVQVDHMGGLRMPFHYSSRIRYSVVSREPQLGLDERAETDYPRFVQDRYLQTPPFASRVAALARDVSHAASTPLAKVTAIHQHLLQTYRYSLDVGSIRTPSPVEDFLFERKTGYCEHYATAMVMLLRSIGIPARLVTGFLATEWNEFGGYFTVRQRDAHAWVEVYFPRSGWITFDPTPPSGTAFVPSRWEVLQRLGESLRLHWDRLFIRYSARDQLAVVQGMRENSEALREQLGTWVSALTAPLRRLSATIAQLTQVAMSGVAGVVIAAGIVALSILLLLIRDRIALWATTHLSASRKPTAIIHLYHRMLRMLARQGVAKSPSSTPQEFVRLVSRERKAAGAVVAAVTDLYYQGRYGGRTIPQGELLRAAEQLGRLPALLREGR